MFGDCVAAWARIGSWLSQLLAVHYRVMEHMGSLESTQEARVALGYRLGQLLRFLRALQTSHVLIHNRRLCMLKHEPIVKWPTTKIDLQIPG